MGVQGIEAFDEDGVSDVNLPNQFYRHEDVKQFKVDALRSIVEQFTGTTVLTNTRFFNEKDKLRDCVVVATDSMSSRKMVWDAFLKQSQCRTLIEARMGGQMGLVYTITRAPQGHGWAVLPSDKAFYEEMLYPDSSVKPVKCTEKAIIYNVLMLASLVCRAYKGVLMGEKVPKEMTFSMTNLTERSWMVRDVRA